MSLGAIARRLGLLIGKGRLHMVNDAAKVQQVQAEFLQGEIRDRMERFQQYGFTSVPLAGMEVLAAFIGGDRSNGVVFAVGDRAYRLTAMKPGEAALYDDQGQVVYLTRDGIVVKGAGKPVTITDTPKVRIEANLEVTGQVKDLCDGGGATMASMRDTYNQHTHPENDGGGPTEPPGQAM